MKRQQGMSSLALVLLLLVIGTLTLAGLNQQLDAFARIASGERQSILHHAMAQSALEWGRNQLWPTVPDIQCRQAAQGRVCLRATGDNRVLLIAGSSEFLLWRGGAILEGRVVFTPHGWSDFCPVKEAALCQLP